MILSSESLINGMSLSHLFYPLHLLLCVCVCTRVWPCTACMWMVVRGHMQGLAEFFATWVQVSFLSTWHKLRSNGKRNPPLRKCLGNVGKSAGILSIYDWCGKAQPLEAVAPLVTQLWVVYKEAKQCSSTVADSVPSLTYPTVNCKMMEHPHKVTLGYGVYCSSKKQIRPMWMSGTELRSPGLAASALTTESAHTLGSGASATQFSFYYAALP